MDHSPPRDLAEADSEETTKSATGRGCRDVDAISESKFFSAVTVAISLLPYMGYSYSQLRHHPDKTRRNTTFDQAQEKADGVQTLVILNQRRKDCNGSEDSDQERNPDVAANALADNICRQFNCTVGHKHAHECNVIPQANIQIKILGETKQSNIADVDAVDKAEEVDDNEENK